MHPDGIISAIFVGLIIGALGRLIVPGRQAIGMIATIIIGLAAAFLGGYIGYKAGFSFGATLIIQLALSAVGVGIVGGGMRGGSRGNRRVRR
jgi:uncharacterized membrane protein YeaQ/YmgE (transglycosylase-associated protein family)